MSASTRNPIGLERGWEAQSLASWLGLWSMRPASGKQPGTRPSVADIARISAQVDDSSGPVAVSGGGSGLVAFDDVELERAAGVRLAQLRSRWLRPHWPWRGPV